MKIYSLTLFSLIGQAFATRPQLTIQVKDGSFGGIEGLDPTISWEGSKSTDDVDLEFGVDVAARPTSDIASLPRTIWGKASKTVSGWATTAKAEIDAQDMSSASYEVDLENSENDLSIKLSGSAGKTFGVAKVEATKRFDADNARVTINPRYNLETEEGDVVVGYTSGNTDVEITASKDSQSVTLSQQVDDENRVAPTLASSGAMSVEWERKLGDDKSVITTFKPSDSIDIEWKDDAWTANVNLPLDGTEITAANVGIKREVTF